MRPLKTHSTWERSEGPQGLGTPSSREGARRPIPSRPDRPRHPHRYLPYSHGQYRTSDLPSGGTPRPHSDARPTFARSSPHNLAVLPHSPKPSPPQGAEFSTPRPI
ncbi:unnamed protein product [Boreogadus saida]